MRQVQEGVMQYMAINRQGGVVEGEDIPDDAVIENERFFIKQGHEEYVDITTLNAERKSSSMKTILLKSAIYQLTQKSITLKPNQAVAMTLTLATAL